MKKTLNVLELLKAATSITVEVTNQMAQVLLGYNKGNRKINKAKVKRILYDMLNGRWKPEVAPPIHVDPEVERLLDGQGRLTAASQLPDGFSVEMAIKSTPENLFPFIDLGQPRSGVDTLTFDGMPSSYVSAYSAAIKWVFYHDSRSGLRPPSVGSNADLLVAQQHYGQELEDSVKFVMDNVKRSEDGMRSPLPPRVSGAVHYLVARVDGKETANDFILKITHGADPADLITKLRDRLIRHRHPGRGQLGPDTMFGLALKCYKLRASGTHVKILSYVKSDEFPSLVPRS